MNKLLLVDDDRELVELLAFALGRAGYEVLKAYDSPSALRLLEDERPDAAILDIKLGPWNGIDLLKSIRARRSSGGLCFIVLSGMCEAADRALGLECAADDYVVKPFSHRELIARLRAQLRRVDRFSSSHADSARPIAPIIRVGQINLDATTHVA